MHRDVKPANILLAPDRTGTPYGPHPAHRLRHLRAAGRRGDPVHADVRPGRHRGLSGARAGHGRAADPRRRPVLAGLHAVLRRRGRRAVRTGLRISRRSPPWSWRSRASRAGRRPGTGAGGAARQGPGAAVSAADRRKRPWPGSSPPQADAVRAHARTDLGVARRPGVRRSSCTGRCTAPVPPRPGPAATPHRASARPCRRRRPERRTPCGPVGRLRCPARASCWPWVGVWSRHGATRRAAAASGQRRGSRTAGPSGSPRPLAGTATVSIADWPGSERVSRGRRRLTRRDPTCRDAPPDGQVHGGRAAGVRRRGAAGRGRRQCEERTREIREQLADVRSLAVVPTEGGFDADGTAHAPVCCWARTGRCTGRSGPFARAGHGVRGHGAPCSERDCLRSRAPTGTPGWSPATGLARRAGRSGSPGWTPVSRFERRGTESDTACARDVPPSDYGFDPSRLPGRAPGRARERWKTTARISSCCTVRKAERGHHGGRRALRRVLRCPVPTNSSTKTMGVLTVGGLVVVTAYTVALGSNGWLWFGWVVLGLITLGMVVTPRAT